VYELLKYGQLKGGFAPDPLTRGFALGLHWGALPPNARFIAPS